MPQLTRSSFRIGETQRDGESPGLTIARVKSNLIYNQSFTPNSPIIHYTSLGLKTVSTGLKLAKGSGSNDNVPKVANGAMPIDSDEYHCLCCIPYFVHLQNINIPKKSRFSIEQGHHNIHLISIPT